MQPPPSRQTQSWNIPSHVVALSPVMGYCVPMKSIHIRVSDEMYARIVSLAEAERRSVTQVCAFKLQAAFEHDAVVRPAGLMFPKKGAKS